MNISTESKSPESLYCEACDHVQFSSYAQFQFHHLHHIRQPLVRLVKLSPTLSWKLRWASYRVNSGVARKTVKFNHVPPLKIALINQQGRKEFCIKREGLSDCGGSPNTNRLSSESDSDPGESLANTDKLFVKGPREVEGKNLLERLGAGFSISRKPAKPMAPTATKPKEDADGVSNAETKTDSILERLSGIGGITISKSSNGNMESKSGGVSISTKQKSIDLTQLKSLKEQVLENDKKVFDKNKILEKLSGSGISIASKTMSQKDGYKTKGESEADSPKPDPQERLANKLNKSEDSNDSSDSKMSTDSRTSHVNASDEIGKTANENSLAVEQKKFIRVKQSSFSKKNMRADRQSSQEEVPEEKEKTDASNEETGINILERLTENLNNSVAAEKSNAEIINNPLESDTDAAETTEDPLAVDPGNLNPSIDASESYSGEVGSVASYNVGGEDHSEDQEQGQGLLLTPPRSSSQDRSSPNFSTVSQNQREYGESDNVSDGGQEVTEEAFSGLSHEDQNGDQGEQQTAFWSDIQNSSDNVDQPQEDPLLTPENSVPNGDSNFLHNFSNEYQSGASNMASENSEFMSLDRLAQSQQHQQRSYGAESSSPMEQLNQQVQRIPNPTPQINVISQHHLQGPPPPPQLHTGVPLSPQHISPQQANSYDSLSQMQPPMPPPPLYQGYMYNQSYPPPPQIPRPPQPQMPMLQQRPHISARSFQPMHVPAQRPRLRTGIKRNLMRPPEMITPPKQTRLTSPLQVGQQVTSTATKLPSGITVTPPKKTLEANKVANVLASRGITVTPSGSRQSTQQPARPQQSRNQNPLNASIIKLGGSVSITSPTQNRSGGFVVPTVGPRRSAPIVNHNAERPERCMTVDLTQDDEVPQSRNRIPPPLRHSCQQCGKYFASLPALAAHEVHHRNMPFKCGVCSAEFTTMNHLVNHRQTHLKKMMSPDLAIPIVDLNHPGARDQLRKCGISNFIPLAQLQSTNNGYFGVPIIQLDTAREKAVSNLSQLGAGNIFVLGKMKSLTSQQNH